MTRNGCQEQQRFKERVSHQVENRRIPCLHAKREEHVANLAHGRVSENTFDQCVPARQNRQQQRNRPDNTHQMPEELPASSGTGRGYGRSGQRQLPIGTGVDQRGSRHQARHRLSKPCLQRQLRRFYRPHRPAASHHPHQHVLAP